VKKFLMAAAAAVALAVFAAPAAQADYNWGVAPPCTGGWSVQSYLLPAVADCHTDYSPGSSTFQHLGNAEFWLAYIYDAGGPVGNFDGWTRWQLNSAGYNQYRAPVNGTYSYKLSNTESYAVVMDSKPDIEHGYANRQYCTWRAYVSGADNNLHLKAGTSIGGACSSW
jgi:opacity protein-like surface antigen